MLQKWDHYEHQKAQMPQRRRRKRERAKNAEHLIKTRLSSKKKKIFFLLSNLVMNICYIKKKGLFMRVGLKFSFGMSPKISSFFVSIAWLMRWDILVVLFFSKSFERSNISKESERRVEYIFLGYHQKSNLMKFWISCKSR